MNAATISGIIIGNPSNSSTIIVIIIAVAKIHLSC